MWLRGGWFSSLSRFCPQLMVAEKNGTIRFYDLVTHQAILSLESEQIPLMSAHWCLKNTFKVGAVAGTDWLIWDITRSRYFLRPSSGSLHCCYCAKGVSVHTLLRGDAKRAVQEECCPEPGLGALDSPA